MQQARLNNAIRELEEALLEEGYEEAASEIRDYYEFFSKLIKIAYRESIDRYAPCIHQRRVGGSLVDQASQTYPIGVRWALVAAYRPWTQQQ
jgi:hypothetical protein